MTCPEGAKSRGSISAPALRHRLLGAMSAGCCVHAALAIGLGASREAKLAGFVGGHFRFTTASAFCRNAQIFCGGLRSVDGAWRGRRAFNSRHRVGVGLKGIGQIRFGNGNFLDHARICGHRPIAKVNHALAVFPAVDLGERIAGASERNKPKRQRQRKSPGRSAHIEQR